MPKEDPKEVFNLFDDEGDGKIDGTQIGDVARALGVKPTNEMVEKASGGHNYRRGEKRLTYEEFYPIYEQLSKEKPVGSQNDFIEGLRVFDKEENGKITGAELKHVLLALGERLDQDQVAEIMDGAEDAEGMINYQAFVKKIMAGPFPEED